MSIFSTIQTSLSTNEQKIVPHLATLGLYIPALSQTAHINYFSDADVYVFIAELLFKQASCFTARAMAGAYVPHVPLPKS